MVDLWELVFTVNAVVVDRRQSGMQLFILFSFGMVALSLSRSKRKVLLQIQSKWG